MVLRTLAAGTAIFVLGALPAMATPVVTDNTSLASPPGVYFGSGNANSNFTVATNDGVELGLSAITRFVGPIVPASGNIYDVPLGATPAPNSGSAWGFDFSINLGASGLTLGTTTATLTMMDAANNTTGSFSPLAIPDNSEYSTGGGVVHCVPPPGTNPTSCANGSNTAAQNSETLSFASIAAAFNDPSYNMNANDTYTFTLTISNAADTITDTDTIVVVAGAPSAVPEPASLILLGTGLLGLAAVRRRRKSSSDLSA